MTDKRLTCEELKAMQEVDVRTVNREALRDIRDVEINASLPKGGADSGLHPADREPILLPTR